MDTESFDCFQKKSFENIELISIETLLNSIPALKVAKENRTLVEFFFTCTSAICTYIFKHYEEVEEIVYLDADIYFFNNPEIIFEEIGDSAISITSHKFRGLNRLRNVYGYYNVGWISFKRDINGLKCLKKWYQQCLDWCYDELTRKKYADQKYLNTWPKEYEGVCVIQHKGANLAPWNLGNYKIRELDKKIYVDDQPLVFYHFASLKAIGDSYYSTCASYFHKLSLLERNRIYGRYISELTLLGFVPSPGLRQKGGIVRNAMRSFIRAVYKDRIQLNGIQKAKVLFILHLPPPVHGAAIIGKYIRESKRINETIDPKYINLSTSRQLSEIGKSGFRKIFIFFKINLKVTYYLLFNKVDLCYVTLTSKSIGLIKDTFTVAILKLFRTKLVYHFNNKGVSLNQHKFIYNILYKYIFRNAQAILTSPLLYYDVKKYVSANRSFFCANGVLKMENIAKRKRPLSSQIRLLFLSNMMEEKGVFDLMQACRILNEKGYGFICEFAGDWGDISNEDFLKKKRELQLSDNVRCVGPQYGDDKHLLLSNADVFILPTFYLVECFPLVLLEAMQYSLPIISTKEGAIPEIIENGVTGYIVQKNNPEDLAKHIEMLINNKELRKTLGDKAKVKFEELYTIDKFETNFINTIDRIVYNS